MKHVFCLLVAGALVLTAADVWSSKAYTDWNEKELRKIMTDSPWAKKTSVLGMDGPAPPSVGSAGGGGGGRGGRGGLSAPDDSASEPISAQRSAGNAGPTLQSASAEVIVSWPSSLPVKQAIAKMKYGKEVTASPEAKQFLEREEMFYIVEVNPLPFRGRTGDEFRDAILKNAVLTVKGKDSVHAADVQVNPHGRTLDIFFLFPRQRVFSVEDAEVEFNAKVGEVPVKQRFKLKEMMFNGKLEL